MPDATEHITPAEWRKRFSGKPNRRQERERALQQSVAQWRDAHPKGHPVRLLHAIPNARLKSGRVIEPAMRAGIPDMHLPVLRPVRDLQVGTLYIELKAPGNKPTETQLAVHDELRQEGHRVEVCCTLEEVEHAVYDHLANANPKGAT